MPGLSLVQVSSLEIRGETEVMLCSVKNKKKSLNDCPFPQETPQAALGEPSVLQGCVVSPPCLTTNRWEVWQGR